MEDFIDKNELLNNSALYLTELGKSKVEEYKRKIFINPLIQWLALIISFIAVIVSIIGLCIQPMEIDSGKVNNYNNTLFKESSLLIQHPTS